MMMQHKTLTGSPIAAAREGFYDRMRRIAARYLREASRERWAESAESARWFCIHVDKGKEFVVENDLLDVNVDAFVAREKWVSVRKGRKIEGERAYMAGYVLVRLKPSPEAFYGLRHHRHVLAIVGRNDGHYHVIRDEDVAVFKSIFEKANTSRMPCDKSFRDGDKAEITHGPFNGFSCLVMKVEWCREAWASVTIDMSGRLFPIARIPLAFLRKL